MLREAAGGVLDRAALAALNDKFEAIRSVLGSHRREALGEDRLGREYFLLGEQVTRIFVCEPAAPLPTSAPISGEGLAGEGGVAGEDSSDDDEGRPVGAVAGEAAGEATGEAMGEATGGETWEQLAATYPAEPSFAPTPAPALAPARAARWKRPRQRAPPPASARAGSRWLVISSAAELETLTASLGGPVADGEAGGRASLAAERRLAAALRRLAPRLAAATEVPLSPADGVLGAICSRCYVQTEQVILCDGAAAAGDGEFECPEEWCFTCAGVDALPEGDWRCSCCSGAAAGR